MAMGSGFHAASAIVDYLNGRHDALRAYERLIDRAFAHYLIMRHDAYSREQRWPHEPFWHRRHEPVFPTEAALHKESTLEPAEQA